MWKFFSFCKPIKTGQLINIPLKHKAILLPTSPARKPSVRTAHTRIIGSEGSLAPLTTASSTPTSPSRNCTGCPKSLFELKLCISTIPALFPQVFSKFVTRGLFNVYSPSRWRASCRLRCCCWLRGASGSTGGRPTSRDQNASCPTALPCSRLPPAQRSLYMV